MIKPPFPGDFDSLARQYWNTWNEMLGRNGGLDAWGIPGGMARSINNPFAGNPFAASLGGMSGGWPPGLAGFDPGAYEWFQQIQRLAADFSNGGAAAGEIADAWRKMMDDEGPHAFARTLRSMHGGLAGGAWMDQVRPMLEALLRPLREQNAQWLHRPAFGPMREHQERLQALALAWQEWDQRNEAFNQLLAGVGQDAFARFEAMLQACDEPGKRLESARALFDLWIDAAEEAWAELALTDEYRTAYGEMTNAMMRLRLGLQREVEQFAALLGMPGRTEVDALARKVADLERTQHAARRAARAATGKAAEVATARRQAAAPVATRAAVRVAAVEAPAPIAVPAVEPAKAAKAAKSGKAGKKNRTAVARRAKAAKPAEPAAAGKAVPKRKRAAAARKSPAKPVAAPASAAAKAPARRSPSKAAGRGASQASTATARKAKVAKSGARKPAAKTQLAPATAKVVSMKDWVSRNLPGIEPPVAPARRGKSGRK